MWWTGEASLWRGGEEESDMGKLGFPSLGPWLTPSAISLFGSHWTSEELSGWWEIGLSSVGQGENECHGLERLTSLL